MPPKADVEAFKRTVYASIQQLEVPCIDEKVYSKIRIKEENVTVQVTFVYVTDPFIIQGFLRLAKYFKSCVIKVQDAFYIPVQGGMLFDLTI